jgi:hypothetical protein
MGVVYRAIWEDDRQDLAVVARNQFAEWLSAKDIHVDIPDDGQVEDDRITVTCSDVEADEARALRLRLEEDGDEQYWSTTVNVIEKGSRCWGWVDLEWVANDVYTQPPDFASPRIARRLVCDGHARVGRLVLRDDPMIVSSDDVPRLADIIFDEDRQLPIAVCTMAMGENFDSARDRAMRAARTLAGVALVAFVTGPAVDRLNEALGQGLTVFGGAVRTYLPGVDPDSPRGFRHRYIKRQQITRHPQAAAHILSRLLLRQSAGLRPPEVFRRALRGAFAGSSDTDLDALLEMQYEELVEFQQRLRDAEDALEMATLEQEEAQSQADSFAARVRFLEDRLAEVGAHVRGAPTPEEDLPTTAETLSEVAALVRTHLSKVSLPDSATPDLERLDEHPRAGVWAKKAWQSLRAMEEYARLKGAGEIALDFRTANARGVLDSYGIQSNWVSMHESDTTDQNPAYRAARTFPVPPAVDDASEVYMDAHVKLQPGGRPCPRIHFHDDTGGATGKIHVGWLGDHLENKQTN